MAGETLELLYLPSEPSDEDAVEASIETMARANLDVVDLEAFEQAQRHDPDYFARLFFDDVLHQMQDRLKIDRPLRITLGYSESFAPLVVECEGVPTIALCDLFIQYLMYENMALLLAAERPSEAERYRKRLIEWAYNTLVNRTCARYGILFYRLVEEAGNAAEQAAQRGFAMELFAILHETAHVTMDGPGGAEEEYAADERACAMYAEVFRHVAYLADAGDVERVAWAPLLFADLLNFNDCLLDLFRPGSVSYRRSHPSTILRRGRIRKALERAYGGEPDEGYRRSKEQIDAAFLQMRRDFGRSGNR